MKQDSHPPFPVWCPPRSCPKAARKLRIVWKETVCPETHIKLCVPMSLGHRRNHWLSLLTWLLPESIFFFLTSHPISSHIILKPLASHPPGMPSGSSGGALLFKGDTVYLSFLNRHATNVWGVCQTSQVHWVRIGSPALNELHIRYRLNGTPAKTWFWIQVVNAALTTINIRPAGEKLCWSLLKMETWI